MKKAILLLILTVMIAPLGWSQDYLTPVRTDVAGFPNWSDTDVSGDVYLKLIYATAQTVAPELNFNLSTSESLSFMARTYGGVNASENTVYIAISEDAGATWLEVASRTPLTTTLTPMTPVDLSGYEGTQVRIKFYVSGTSNSVGVGIDDLSITGVLEASVPPLLVADETDNDVDHTLDISFIDDAVWRGSITSVEIGGSALTPITDYLLSAGMLQLLPSGGNPLLTTAGSKSVTVEATGYQPAAVIQIINAGVATTNSTAVINANLALNATRTVTCTANDQYYNPVAGVLFKYDLTVTDNSAVTNEAYLVDGTTRSESIADVSVVAATSASGEATFEVSVPGFVDHNDGIGVQVQLPDGISNIGSPFTFTQTQTTLLPGDIAFTAYQFDDPDTYSFVLLRDVGENTTLSFTDNGWTGSALTTNEGTTTWSVPEGGLPSGTRVTISGNTVTGGGTAVSAPAISLSAAGDQLLAYQGSSSSPSFIAALSSPGFISSGTVTTNTTYLPVGLTELEHALAIAPQTDNGYYQGIAVGTGNFLRPAINNPENWVVSNSMQVWPTPWQFALTSATDLTLSASVCNLTIAAGESLLIHSGVGLTVTGSLLNEAGVASLVVSSGGSLLQSSPLVEATVQRVIQAWTDAAHGWHFLSSPVTSQAMVPAFTDPVSTNYDLYQWDEPSSTWLNQKVAENAITTFIPGKGYLVAYASTSTKSFSGTLNTGDVNFTNISRTGNSDGAGWNLAGNPFPCSLKWNDGVTWTVPANVAGVAKVWNANDASYTDIAPGDLIPPMNGFMVELLTGTPETLTIPAAAQAHDASASWYKSSGEPRMVFVVKDLEAHTAQRSVIQFNSLATNGFDPSFDAHFIEGYAPAFYSISGAEQLSTNTLPESGGDLQIPFVFEKKEGSAYTIALQSVHGIYGPLILTDLKTGEQRDLTMDSVYPFTAVEGDLPERFVLGVGHVGIDGDGSTSPAPIFAYGNQIVVAVLDCERVEIYGLTGKLLVTHQTEMGCVSRVKVEAPNGYYVVRATTPSSTLVKRIYISQ